MSATPAWDLAAVETVEQSIHQLLEEFKRHPFTHRREHSLHVDLYQILISREPLEGRHQIGDTNYRTRLVHKEWPSSQAFSLSGQKKPKRQNYDIGILSPVALNNTSLADFSQGRPTATIAIELGLDYGHGHLAGDIKKLRLNEVRHAYIVHFSRVRTSQVKQIEELIQTTSESTSIKTAFAHLDVAKRSLVYKTLDGAVFETSLQGEA